MDETRRLREPAAWLLLAVVLVGTLATLVRLAFSFPDFQTGALAASSEVLGIAPAALPFAAVLLATKFGPLLMRARLIVIAALSVQGFAALIGVVCWLGGSFGSSTNLSVLVYQFLGGAAWLALLGVSGFYTFTVLKTPELAPAPKPQPQPGFGQQYPGMPGGGYPGMQQPGQPGMQPGQPGQAGPPPGYAPQGPQPGYPSGQQAPMPGYQPQEYGTPESTSQMPSVGDPEETHNFGAQQAGAQPGFASGPQPGFAAPDQSASGPHFAPPPGQSGPAAQPGWPGGYGQQASGPQQPQPGPGWPSGGYAPSGPQQPQQPEPYGQSAYRQPGQGGAFGQQPPQAAFGEQPEAPSPYQEPPQYGDPSQYGAAAGQSGPQEPQQPPASGEQQAAGPASGGFDALFGGRPESDEPDDVQRTYRIPHDPEAFRKNYPPPSNDQ